jgi:hypothetical protein
MLRVVRHGRLNSRLEAKPDYEPKALGTISTGGAAMVPPAGSRQAGGDPACRK